ncbi:hypothetical protein Q7P37_005227 [Cladosporium fusiforme]
MADTADPTTMDTTTTLSPSALQKKLDHLKASATQQYSLKNYSAAAEFFSEAAEVQDQINGEMSPENADLLYQYGRCLYHVGVSKSDVLGGKVAAGGEEPKRKKRKTAPVAESSAAGAANGEGAVSDALKSGEQKLAEIVVGAAVEEKEGGKAEEKAGADKPFFQITGDENWTDSEDDDEEDAEGDEDDEDEDDDDFAIAYEILDVARVLLARKLASLEAASSSPEARQLKERLADTHDLQAEIKLENEQFADAVADAKETLKYKLELFPPESGMIAEAHYKLAIALDFASMPAVPAEEETAAPPKEKKKDEPKVDEAMRAEAASEMEKAIASCQLRMQKDEASLSSSSEASKQETTKRTIADVKSMVAEMKNRLVDLRNPSPAALTAGDPTGALDGSDPMRGVLGAMLGESRAEQAKRLQQATSQANDLSGLVKKRKAKVDVDVDVEGRGRGRRLRWRGRRSEGGN